MEGADDVVVTVDVELVFAFEDNLAATVLREQHNIANLDRDFTDFTVLLNAAGTDSEYGAMVELVALVGGGEDDTRLGLGLSDDFLDDDAVSEGLEGLEREHT